MKFFITLCLSALLVNSSPTIAANEQSTAQVKPSIVALAPHVVEMLYSIGAGEQIIGASAYSDYPEQAKAIPVVSTYAKIQLERIIQLQPDLIIAWRSGSPSDDLARLKQLGFTIIYSGPKTFEDVATEIRDFGELTGHSNKANKLAEKFLAQLTAITARYKNSTPVSAFYEVWSRPLTTIAQGSWPQQYLDICKVTNPFFNNSVPYPQVNIEQILQSPVELIIQPMSAHQKNKELFNWQDWPSIDAVKYQQIIQPNADALHRMSLRSLDELAIVCEAVDKTRHFYLDNLSSV